LFKVLLTNSLLNIFFLYANYRKSYLSVKKKTLKVKSVFLREKIKTGSIFLQKNAAVGGDFVLKNRQLIFFIRKQSQQKL